MKDRIMTTISLSSSPVTNNMLNRPPILLTGGWEEVIAGAVAAGADALEIRLRETDDEDWDVFKKQFSDAGLVIAGISTGRMFKEGGHCLTALDRSGRRACTDALKAYVDIAKALDTDLLLGTAKGQQQTNETYADYAERMADTLKDADNYAREMGVKMHLECINYYEINAMNTAQQTLDFIHEYDLNATYVQLDTFHMNIDEVDLAESVRICGDKLGYIQFADSNRWYPGAGHIDFVPILDALDEIGYAGIYGVECQPLPDSATACQKSVAFLREALARR